LGKQRRVYYAGSLERSKVVRTAQQFLKKDSDMKSTGVGRRREKEKV